MFRSDLSQFVLQMFVYAQSGSRRVHVTQIIQTQILFLDLSEHSFLTQSCGSMVKAPCRATVTRSTRLAFLRSRTVWTDFLTIRRVLKHQALQFGPLCVESLHQLVGVHWVSEVALGVSGGRSGQSVQFRGPAKRQTDKNLLLDL